MEIILLRHGEVPANTGGGLSLGLDDELTDLGIRQAKAAAKRLAGMDIDMIYSSPLTRARQTAEHVGLATGIEIHILPELSESGLHLGSGFAFKQPVYADHDSLGPVPVDTEDADQFFTRIKTALKIITGSKAKRILAVSHGHTIRELINQLLGIENRIRFPHGNCHASSIGIAKTIWVNYINHRPWRGCLMR
jgi:broad specificity phosphatase PhoE